MKLKKKSTPRSDLIIGKQTLHDIRAVLDFIEKEGYTVVALDRLIKDMTK